MNDYLNYDPVVIPSEAGHFLDHSIRMGKLSFGAYVVIPSEAGHFLDPGVYGKIA